MGLQNFKLKFLKVGCCCKLLELKSIHLILKSERKYLMEWIAKLRYGVLNLECSHR
jgi:hypothetical protein